MFKVILVSVFFLHAAIANDKGNGGDAIVCGPHKNDRSRIVKLADVHEAYANRELISTEFWDETFSEEKALQEMIEEMRQSPHLYAGVEAALKTIRFEFVETLEELDDDNIKEMSSIPVLTMDLKIDRWACRKQQLAIQNRATGVVRVNSSLYVKLNPVERAFLRVHEALIYLTGDTNRTRGLVHWLFERPGFSLNYQNLAQLKLEKIQLGRDEHARRIVGAFAKSFSSRRGGSLPLDRVITSLNSAFDMKHFLDQMEVKLSPTVEILGSHFNFGSQVQISVHFAFARNLINGGLCLDAKGNSLYPVDQDVYAELGFVIKESKIFTNKDELASTPERFILRASRRLCSQIVVRGLLK